MGLSTLRQHVLLAYANRRVKRHIAELPGIEHHQSDGDSEVFRFPVDRLETVAAILKPKRLKGSARLTAEQLANLQEGRRRLEKQRQESPETVQSRDEGVKPRLSPMSPTQHSLAHLRSQGYLVAIVEHWNSFTKRRNDVFQFADILAVKDGITLAVQTTTRANMAARLSKLTCIAAVGQCIRSGSRVEIHGWAKHKVKRGGTAYRYQLRVVVL